MVQMRSVVAAALLVALAAAHGDEHDKTSNAASDDAAAKLLQEQLAQYELPSYAGLEAHSGMMLAHVVFMVLAWFFILPVGVIFSIARSKFALPVQLVFLALNGVGVVLGTVYNASTPDLYENNAHHSIGWIATWIVTAQVIMSLLFVYAGRTKTEDTTSIERAAFLPATLSGMDRLGERPYKEYRWSGDSGHGTEVESPSSQSRDTSPSDSGRMNQTKPEEEADDEDFEHDLTTTTRSRLLRNTFLDKYLSARGPRMFSSKFIKTMEITYEVIDRAIIILGFLALVTGGVTYAGILRGKNIFNGLAHFIKGGIFFWYGLLTLGRWMGCFADFGWAWNVKPTRSEVGRWKALIPTAEFTESFVIWLYGCTNVFLEHLTAPGGAWTAQDLEHVSISIMFFGGGLFGMLVESKTIRSWLNNSVDMMPTRVEVRSSEAQEVRIQPKTYSHSMNPVPALVILLLGIMMSSHHQDSMVSTMVHKQWGTLLCGFSLARGFTYVITYISPPTSIYPARPPTELISSFCLISGGIIFVASNKDIIHYLEANNLMAMFVFTVTMGFTAFLMAYEMFVLSLRGWAVRREQRITYRY